MSLLDSQGRAQNYGRVNNNLYSSTTPLTESRSSFSRSKCIFVGALIIITLAVIVGGIVFGLKHRKKAGGTPKPPQPLPSKLGEFQSTVVVSDSEPCSPIGYEMLKRNGTVVDAAIAALFCMGVYTGQSMGIGGGFFMTIYNRTTKQSIVVDARETAPSFASEEMYKGNETLSSKGGMSVAVPGELRGYWETHKKFGRLPWEDLVQPAIRLCHEGFTVGMHLARTLKLIKNQVLNEPSLREVFVDPLTNDIKKKGDVVTRHKLGETLETIAAKGVDAFYNGLVGENFIKDVSDYGGKLTMDDLRNYKVNFKNATASPLSNGLTLYSVPPPGSGAILGYILEVLARFKFDNESLSTSEKSLLTYQRIVEAFKFGYGKRSQLGDEDFVNITELIKNLTSPEFAEETKGKILDNRTFTDYQHYGAYYQKDDKGTAQLNILGPDGDAISVTSTINYWFGAQFRSTSTGIIPNNEMDDFSAPHIINMFGLPPSPANFIKPGKRPLSSMCPAVIVDSNGDAILVIGGAGGSKITSAASLVAAKVLYMNQNIKVAIDAPRLHHQLMPPVLEYEPNFPEDVLAGLREIGHSINKTGSFGSVILAIHQPVKGKIQANYDYRKGGSFAGV